MIRILGISPHSKGLGFVVLENNYELIDWGHKCCSTKPKTVTCSRITPSIQLNKNCLRAVTELIEFYEPDLVITEDWSVISCQRQKRVKTLLSQIHTLAEKRNLKTKRYSRLQIQKQFANYKVKTKHEIAVCLSSLFAELYSYLPKPRKAWMSEDRRIHVFTALSLCLVFTEGNSQTQT